MQFKKYKDDGILDKPSFMKEMRELIVRCNGSDLSDNMKMKMDSTLISLYSLFDIDKNGILKSDEVCAALCILCKGSIASKIKFGIRIFSSTDTENDIKIRRGELQQFLFFIFKLSLESGNEIMLDYPLDTLTQDVAKACFTFNGIEDLDKGEIRFDQVMKYLNKQSSLGI